MATTGACSVPNRLDTCSSFWDCSHSACATAGCE